MAKNDQAAKDTKPDAANEQPKTGDPAASLAAEVFGSSPSQVKPADAQPPAQIAPVALTPPPTLESIAARDPIMAALLKQLDDMRQEIAQLKNPAVAPPAPAEVRDFSAPAAIPMNAPRKFKVSLPHAPDGIVTVETHNVREIDWKDRAITAYVDAMGINKLPNGAPNTVHQFAVQEV